MSFSNTWDLPNGSGRGSRGRFRTNRAASRGRRWPEEQTSPYTSTDCWEQPNFTNYQEVQDPEYFSNRRRFQSPTPFKSPIFDDTPRPPSPLPGSEEYTQRNIQQTSELIKRQLNLEGQTEDFIGNEFEEPMYMHNEEFMHRQDLEIVDNKKIDKVLDLGQSVKRTNKFRNRNRSSESIDVNEIHDKIIKHISKLSYNKKMNLVNQGLSGYDLAIQQIQKQQRLELSRALRDMSTKTTQDSSDCEVINSIIPDIGIKIEDLPREVIAQLSSTLDIDFDVNIVNPETCFKQAKDLLDNQGYQQGQVLDPFDFEYLNTPRESKAEGNPRISQDRDEFVLEINPNSSYLSGKNSEGVHRVDEKEKSDSMLTIRSDLRESVGETNGQFMSSNVQKNENKLGRGKEVAATSNGNNFVKKDNSHTPNLDLVLSQNLWLNNPEPKEQSYKPLRNHSTRNLDTKYIPPLIPPDQLPKRDFTKTKYIPPLIPPNQLTFDKNKDYSQRNHHFENDYHYENRRKFELEQQQLSEKRTFYDPVQDKMQTEFSPLLSYPQRNDYSYEMSEFHDEYHDGNRSDLHNPTIAERMYSDMQRMPLSKFSKRNERKKKAALMAAMRSESESRRNRRMTSRSRSNELYDERRQRRSTEDFGRRSEGGRNSSWSRSRSKDNRSYDGGMESFDVDFKGGGNDEDVGLEKMDENCEDDKLISVGEDEEEDCDKQQIEPLESEDKDCLVKIKEIEKESVDKTKDDCEIVEDKVEEVPVKHSDGENGKKKPFRIPKLSQKKENSLPNKNEESNKDTTKMVNDVVSPSKKKHEKDKNVQEKLNELVDNEIKKAKDSIILKKEAKKGKEKGKSDKESPKNEEKEMRKLRSKKSAEKDKIDEKEIKKVHEKEKITEKDRKIEMEGKKGRSKKSEECESKRIVDKEVKVKEKEVKKDDKKGLEDFSKTVENLDEDKVVKEVNETSGLDQRDANVDKEEIEQIKIDNKEEIEENNVNKVENIEENLESGKVNSKQANKCRKVDEDKEKVENLVEHTTVLEIKEEGVEVDALMDEKENSHNKLDCVNSQNDSNKVVNDDESISRIKIWKSPGERKLLPQHVIDSEDSTEAGSKLTPRALNFEDKEEKRDIFEQMADFNTLMSQTEIKSEDTDRSVEAVQNAVGEDEVKVEESVQDCDDVAMEVNKNEVKLVDNEEEKSLIGINEVNHEGIVTVDEVVCREGKYAKKAEKIEDVVDNVPRRSKSGINRSKSNARPKSKQKGYLEAKIKELNENLTSNLENNVLSPNKKRKRSTSTSSTKKNSKGDSENESEVANTSRIRRNSLRSNSQIERPKSPCKVESQISIETQTDPVYVVQEFKKEIKVKSRKTNISNVVKKMKEIDKLIEDLSRIRQGLYEELCLESEEETCPTRKRSCEETMSDTTKDPQDLNSPKPQKISKKHKKKKHETLPKNNTIDDSITAVIQQFSDDSKEESPPSEPPANPETPFLHPANVPHVNNPEINNKLSVRLIRYNIADLERFKGELKPINEEPLLKLVSDESEKLCENVSEKEVVRTNINVDYKGWFGSILVIKVLDNVVVAGNDRGSLYFYDLIDSDLKAQMVLGQKPITSICVGKSKETKTIYVGSLDGTLNVVDFVKNEISKSVQVDDPIQCMESSWGFIFIGSHKGNLIRYDIKKEKLEDGVSISNTSVLVLRATQEGARKVLLVATRNYPISVRDAMTGLLMRTMEGTLNPTVYTLLFHNSHVYCGTSQHDVLVYTFQDGQLMFKHEQSNTSGVVCMTIVKNLLFVGCYNGNIYVYNTNTNEFITTIAGPGGLFLSMEVSGDIIVAGTKQNHFKAWTLPDAVLSQIV